MDATEAEKTRVAYLTYDGLTDPLGQSQILPYILGLEAKGFEFVIISFEKPTAYREGKEVIERAIAGKKIKWLPMKYHKYPPVLSTLFDLYHLWLALKWEHKKVPIHIVHCRSYITSLVGQSMKKKHGVKFIFDMRGFWADERVEGGLWNLSNPLYRMIYNFFKRKEKQFIAGADHIISLTENAKQEILSWGIKASPITVIPTCVDLDLFDPKKIKKEDQNGLRHQLGIKPDDYILLYLGSWGTWYLTKEMLDFFSELKKQKPQAKFLIVTPDKIDLDGYAFEDQVIITRAPRNLVPLYISLASASVFFIKPSYSKKASSATKMGEIMAMGVPVVVNGGWGDVEILKSLGAAVPYSSGHFLVDRRLIKDQSAMINNISLNSGVEKYTQTYFQSLSIT
jgi:glycosyltransferase involved in cell wall biosynthesis